MTEKEKYEKAFKEYFERRAKVCLRAYPNFESLNKANSKALKAWSEVKNDIKNHEIYHKHANLSTLFKTIKGKLEG